MIELIKCIMQQLSLGVILNMLFDLILTLKLNSIRHIIKVSKGAKFNLSIKE